MTIFRTATKKGQITLPIKFRKKVNTNNYLLEEKSDYLIIRPVKTDETVIFNAERDNKGEPVELGEFLNSLEKALHG